MSFLYTAKNGCNSPITLGGIKVYFNWDYGLPISILGQKKDKRLWIENNLLDDYKNKDIIEDTYNKLFVDWELYENGWFIVSYKDSRLFNYKTQMRGQIYPPKEYIYFKKE